MSRTDKTPDELLARFCEDDFEDNWEEQQAENQLHYNRYTDKEFLAAGGLKNIFKVFDSKLNREVALAELKDNLPEEQCEAFLKEVNLTASLRHPNIITVFDYGVTEEQQPFFTMELKVGDSLADIIKKQRRTLKERLEIFIKVCDAVAYAHSQKILHLDLKPENIQVGEYGEVQLCDWGLSQSVENQLVTEKVSGTPGYMAPEQLEKGAQLDCRTDLFALGAILYSLITEKAPIAGGINTVIDSTELGKIPTPAERFPQLKISKSLNAVVEKSMAPNPDKRYRSVENLKHEISQFLNGHSTTAENAGFLTELNLLIRRNRQICFISFLASSILMASAVFFLIEIQQGKNSTEEALKELRKAYAYLQEAQRNEINLHKQKEETQKLYFKEKIQKEKMYSELLDKELKLATDLMTAPRFYNSPQKAAAESLKILKGQLTQGKNQKNISSLIVLNLFISQKFAEIQNYPGHRYGILKSLAKKYQNNSRNSFGLLNEKDFIAFIKDLTALPGGQNQLKKQCIERAICYMFDVRKPVFTSTELVKQILKCWNPEWDPRGITYNSQNLTLTLRGKKLHSLKGTSSESSGLSFIRFLKIDSLDIRQTSIESLGQIEGANVNKVDIRQTKVSDLHPHNSTKEIKEVYLSPGQFTAINVQHRPHSIKLVYLTK